MYSGLTLMQGFPKRNISVSEKWSSIEIESRQFAS
jgi:hypothetical protein